MVFTFEKYFQKIPCENKDERKKIKSFNKCIRKNKGV